VYVNGFERKDSPERLNQGSHGRDAETVEQQAHVTIDRNNDHVQPETRDDLKDGYSGVDARSEVEAKQFPDLSLSHVYILSLKRTSSSGRPFAVTPWIRFLLAAFVSPSTCPRCGGHARIMRNFNPESSERIQITIPKWSTTESPCCQPQHKVAQELSTTVVAVREHHARKVSV